MSAAPLPVVTGNTGNPLLDSPTLKAALAQQMAQQQPAGNPPPMPAPGAMQSAPSIGPAPMPSGSPTPNLPAPSKAQITAPQGTVEGDENKRAQLLQQGSGISRIAHNIEGTQFGQDHPLLGKIGGNLLQGLARVGDIGLSLTGPGRIAESMIPGTAGFHAAQLRNTDTALTQDEANREKEAQTADFNAGVPLKDAQTREAEARADAAAHPVPKQPEYDIKETVDDKGQPIYAAVNKSDPSDVHMIPTMKVPPKPEATPKLNDFESFYKDYITDNNLPDSAHNRLMARKEFAAAGQAPQRPAQVTIVTPGGQVEAVHPGDTIAPGSTTVGGFNAESVAGNKQTTADAKTAADAKKDYTLMQTLAANPSPTNDLAMVMHYIGATKPDSMGKLRLNQNEISLVMGTRDSFGDLEAMAEKIRNGQMLTPQQRQDMLKTMQILSGASGGGKGSVNIADAMKLPANKGKSQADVEKDIESHGYTVAK